MILQAPVMQLANASDDDVLGLGTVAVMGILNATPDSFSDGGQFDSVSSAVDHALRMVEAGASIIDVGGESTRPGAGAVSETQELERVIPVIEALRARSDVLISIDTSKPAVMRAAVRAGAGMINDVRALQLPDAIRTAAAANVPVCLMHMQGTPGSMQDAPQYDDPVVEVMAFLQRRIEACVAGGVMREHLIVDPGFGFGKRLSDNLVLIQQLQAFKQFGLPLLVGLSRKSMLGQITGRATHQRLIGSVILAAECARRGADIVRVHDVAETCEALQVMAAVLNSLQETDPT